MNSVALLLALLAAAGPDRLPPIDQCSADPSFVAFRDGLSATVARKDKAALLAALDEEVLVDLGGGKGKQTFVDAYGLNEPGESLVWEDLGRILALGCATDGTVHILPSMVTQIDRELDLYETVVAVKPGAVLRSGRDASSEVAAELDFDVLTIVTWPDEGDHIRVRMRDGRTGWLHRTHVRSPLDRRITVERVDGEWKITSFVAGD